MYKVAVNGFGQLNFGPECSGSVGALEDRPMRHVLITAGPLPLRLRGSVLFEPVSARALRRVYRTAALAGVR